MTTDPDELIDSEDSEGISGDEEDLFRNLLSRAGFHLSYGDNPSQPQVTLREKLLMDAGAIAGFLTGLRVYLDDPVKVKRLLLPTNLSGSSDGKKAAKTNESSPSLMNLLMGVKVLQQAIIDLLLDIMVECCQPSTSEDDSSDRPSPDDTCPSESSHLHVNDRLDSGTDDISTASAVQSSDMNGNHTFSPPETSAAASSSESSSLRSKVCIVLTFSLFLSLLVNICLVDYCVFVTD